MKAVVDEEPTADHWAYLGTTYRSCSRWEDADGAYGRALAVDPAHGHLIIASAIDNLVKGAAGQAVQCMNLLCGLEETCGLGATRARAEPLA